MMILLAYFTAVAYIESFPGDLSRPENFSITLIVFKLIQATGLALADLDREHWEVQRNNCINFITTNTLETMLIVVWCCLYFRECLFNNQFRDYICDTFDNPADVEFKNQIIIGITVYSLVFIPFKVLFALSLKELTGRVREKAEAEQQ